MNGAFERFISPVVFAAVAVLASIASSPLAAADLDDISREIRKANRATRDGKYIVDQIQSVAKVVTVKRKDALPQDPDNVVFYTAERCDDCSDAREYMERNNIAYIEHDVESSDKGRSDYRALGRPGVPILLIGEERLNGWSESRFKRLHSKFKPSTRSSTDDDREESIASDLEPGTVLTAKIDNVAVFAVKHREGQVVVRLKKGEEVVMTGAASDEWAPVESASGSGWVDTRLFVASE